MLPNLNDRYEEDLEFAMSLLEEGKGEAEIVRTLNGKGYDQEASVWLMNQAKYQKARIQIPDTQSYQMPSRQLGFKYLLIGGSILGFGFAAYSILTPAAQGDDNMPLISL